MNIIEHATKYGRVRTPMGDGNVLKLTMQEVCVELDKGGIEMFRQEDVQSIPDRRATDRLSTRKDYSFSQDQLDAGKNTELLK